jgi:hypothetical protein
MERWSNAAARPAVLQYPPGSDGWRYVHELSNTKQPNGRINATKDGVYLAYSISPSAPQFQSNVEDGVRELVLTCLQHEVFPFSSCEGHRGSPKCTMLVAFTDEKRRDRFIHSLPWYLRWRVSIEPKAKSCNTDVAKHQIVTPQASDEEEARFFNTMFNRNEPRWFACQVQIFFKLPLLSPFFARTVFVRLMSRWVRRWAAADRS